MSKRTSPPRPKPAPEVPTPVSLTEAQEAFAQAAGQALATAWLTHLRHLAANLSAEQRRSTAVKRHRKPDRNSQGT